MQRQHPHDTRDSERMVLGHLRPSFKKRDDERRASSPVISEEADEADVYDDPPTAIATSPSPLSPVTLEAEALVDDDADEVEAFAGALARRRREQLFDGSHGPQYTECLDGPQHTEFSPPLFDESEVDEKTPSQTKILVAPSPSRPMVSPVASSIMGPSRGEVLPNEGTLILPPSPAPSVRPPSMVAPLERSYGGGRSFAGTMPSPSFAPAPMSAPAPLHMQPVPPSVRSMSESWNDRGAWSMPSDDTARRDMTQSRNQQTQPTLARKVSPREIVLLVVSLTLAACAAITIVKLGRTPNASTTAAAVAPPPQADPVPVSMSVPTSATGAPSAPPVVTTPPSAMNPPAPATDATPEPAPAPVSAAPATHGSAHGRKAGAKHESKDPSDRSAKAAPEPKETKEAKPAPEPKEAKEAKPVRGKEKKQPAEAAPTTSKSDAEILDALRDEQLRR